MELSSHSRLYLSNRFVYPVLSRRSKGISIGINLNPDKICNFDCIYCQVDRRTPDEGSQTVNIGSVLSELRNLLISFKDESIYLTPPFIEIPRERVNLKDIAYSGDGEPSLFPGIFNLTREVISLKNSLGFPNVKLIMITNASGISRPETLKAIGLLDADQGTLWAKLDAGTEAYFHQVCRTGFSFQKILDNILLISQKRSIVIQSCFMKINREVPSKLEIESYSRRLIDFVNAGGRFDLIQVYTVARKPTESYVQPLENSELDEIAEIVRNKSGLAVETYYHS
ncbi:MAG: radical SAM protein [Nitrospirae bacterium]|nr:radical SAM protein [Nitrospirota bacterium]MBI3595278.1 radical SAM protein [Nitrospirota bacterium]